MIGIGSISRLLQKYRARAGRPLAALTPASVFTPLRGTFRSPTRATFGLVANRCVSSRANHAASAVTGQIAASSGTAQTTKTPNNLQVLGEPPSDKFSAKSADIAFSLNAPISFKGCPLTGGFPQLIADLREQFDNVMKKKAASKTNFRYLVIEGGSGFDKTRLGVEITKRLFDGVPRVRAYQLFVNANSGIGATKSGVYSDGEAWLLNYLKAKQRVPATVTDFESAICALADQSGKEPDDWCVVIMQIDEFQQQPKFAASLIRASYEWNFFHDRAINDKVLLFPIMTGLSSSTLNAQGEDISALEPTASFRPHVLTLHGVSQGVSGTFRWRSKLRACFPFQTVAPSRGNGNASAATAQTDASSRTVQTKTPNSLQALAPPPQNDPQYTDMVFTLRGEKYFGVSAVVAALREQFVRVMKANCPDKHNFRYLVIEGGSGFDKTRLGVEITKRLFDGVPRMRAYQLFVNANSGIGATKSGVYSDGEAWLLNYLKEQKHVPSAVTDYEGAICALAHQSGKKPDDWCVVIMQVDEFQQQPEFAASLIRASYKWNFSQRRAINRKVLLFPIMTGLSSSTLNAQGKDISALEPTASFRPHVLTPTFKSSPQFA